MKIHLYVIFLLTVAVTLTIAKHFEHHDKQYVAAPEARYLAMVHLIESRGSFVNQLLTTIIPEKADHGETQIWLLSDEYPIPLNSDDAKVLSKYGYKIEMCIDGDRIAYIRWD